MLAKCLSPKDLALTAILHVPYSGIAWSWLIPWLLQVGMTGLGSSVLYTSVAGAVHVHTSRTVADFLVCPNELHIFRSLLRGTK